MNKKTIVTFILLYLLLDGLQYMAFMHYKKDNNNDYVTRTSKVPLQTK